MRRRVNLHWTVAILVIATLLLAACAQTEDTGPEGIIRFTFAPDPVWDTLIDTGIRDEMEEACDLRILAAPTWDEFGVYAGGHADIVSVASWEVPVLDQESGQDSTIFGKYNIERSVVVVPVDSPAQSLADVVGGKVAVWDSVGPTLIWGVLAEELHGLDFRVGSGDFDLVLADITNTAELAATGDVDAALILPDFSVPQLMSGKLRVLYDEKTAADLYDELVGTAHEGPMINVFLARSSWYDAHPDEVACFMDIWERCIQEWQANKDEIIASYPQHFAVETEEEIAFITDWLNRHDWFVSTVYMDDAWVERESMLFDLMRKTGFMDEDQEDPKFDVVRP